MAVAISPVRSRGSGIWAPIGWAVRPRIRPDGFGGKDHIGASTIGRPIVVLVPEVTASQGGVVERGVLEERRSSPGLLLALLGHVAMRRLRAAHTASHLSPRQFHLLGLLHDHGPMGQTDLGQTMGTDPSILVTMLNPLEADSLIARERDPADRRRHLVRITAAGEKRLGRAAEDQRRAEDALF